MPAPTNALVINIVSLSVDRATNGYDLMVGVEIIDYSSQAFTSALDNNAFDINFDFLVGEETDVYAALAAACKTKIENDTEVEVTDDYVYIFGGLQIPTDVRFGKRFVSI